MTKRGLGNPFCCRPLPACGLDFLGWLRDPPPPDTYLLSSPITAPMTAVLQLAHVWVCWHCLRVPLQVPPFVLAVPLFG